LEGFINNNESRDKVTITEPDASVSSTIT